MNILPYLALTAAVLVPLAACEEKSSNSVQSPRGSTQIEYIAEAPDGTLSPIFQSDRELKRYIKANANKFPNGTVLHQR